MSNLARRPLFRSQRHQIQQEHNFPESRDTKSTKKTVLPKLFALNPIMRLSSRSERHEITQEYCSSGTTGEGLPGSLEKSSPKSLAKTFSHDKYLSPKFEKYLASEIKQETIPPKPGGPNPAIILLPWIQQEYCSPRFGRKAFSLISESGFLPGLEEIIDTKSIKETVLSKPATPNPGIKLPFRSWNHQILQEHWSS